MTNEPKRFIIFDLSRAAPVNFVGAADADTGATGRGGESGLRESALRRGAQCFDSDGRERPTAALADCVVCLSGLEFVFISASASRAFIGMRSGKNASICFSVGGRTKNPISECI